MRRDKLEAIIAYLVKNSHGGFLARTKLVKLVFLADYEYYRTYGETMTGVGYTYCEEGPFDWSIPNTAQEMADIQYKYYPPGLLHSYAEHRYTGIGTLHQSEKLSAEEEAIAHEVLREYGSYNAGRLVGLLHEDEFVKECGPGNPIDFHLLDRDPLDDQEVQDAIMSDASLYESMIRATRQTRERFCSTR
jgi:hypothetical protein